MDRPQAEIPTPGIPRGSGEVVCIPPLPCWQAVAEENAANLNRSSALLDGEPLGAFRRAVREEVLMAAAHFGRRWGLRPGGELGPLVVTGHQPVFYHPGIWVKNLVLDLCPGVRTLNLIVDSDAVEVLDVAVPRRNGELRTVHRVLVRCPSDVPFEATPPPTQGQWRKWIEAIGEDLATLDRPELLRGLERLSALGEREREACENLGEFVARLRRAFEPAPAYPELPVSWLCRTRGFLRFVRWMADSCESFWAAYNEALEAHRRAEGIRSSAQPFPNLRRQSGCYELPLWTVRAGRRRPVFARRTRGGVVLSTEEELVRISPHTPPEALAEEAFRPRGMALTLFVRVCVADLFVHGVGGALYDRATDQLIRNLFALDPPSFAVVTATFHLPLPSPEDPGSQRARLQQRLYELLHNPDRFLEPQDPHLQCLVEEKWGIIRRLQEGSLTRRERRALTHRIRAINQELSAPLAEEIQRVREALARLEPQETAYAAATYRGYPFFLFDGEALRRVLQDRLISPS
ncbi:MAG: hypothetical protein N0A24_02245 [Armatimonadetes bacterium]|nr:hypothetical protein [Armatimonadota bacterium]MDW8153035.1 hypothetical protein [Armatimonadota bacterium]